VENLRRGEEEPPLLSGFSVTATAGHREQSPALPSAQPSEIIALGKFPSPP